MDNILKFSKEERIELFGETAARRKMAPAVVEKDFWVCWILKRLFSCSDINSHIIFKGGTSLSKVFNIIERFSEDVDLILNWELLTSINPQASGLSRTKQDKINKQIDQEARDYIKEVLLPLIDHLVNPVCAAVLDEDDGNIIQVKYPASFPVDYILPYIKLEIGPLAAWQPHSVYRIKPYAAEEFPHLFTNPDTEVLAIKAERTFWEKITILHQEAHRPVTSPQPKGYSRHYYDVFQLMRSEIAESALTDLSLLTEVVDFKKRFYPRKWAQYDFARPGTLKLVPPKYLLNDLEKDYAEMEIMIYGKHPDFAELMNNIEIIEKRLNNLQP
jgi:hypothetical protein